MRKIDLTPSSGRDRVIMHIDMNSYFAMVEQQANPHLRGRPVGVGGPNEGRTVIAAASVEAKKFGVKSGMTIHQARNLCPDIIHVQGDYNKYAFVTDRVLRIFRRYTPILEIFSIDEAFLDVTPTIGSMAGAIKAARQIKDTIRREVGEILTCSVGIAPNKLIAKLASDMKKPDGLVVIPRHKIPALLDRIELSDLCGIGSRTRKNLLAMGIDTVAKLREAPLATLVRRFGKWGFILHRMSRGEDDSPVVPYYQHEEPKSMGHSLTLPKDTTDRDEIFATLMRLSEQVGRRMRAECYLGRTIWAGVRKGDFVNLGAQKTLNRWIDDGYEIYRTARTILEGFNYHGPVRLVGVSVRGLVQGAYQMSILEEDQRRERLNLATDEINNRFGEFTVGRASLMKTRTRKRGPSGMGASRAMSRYHSYEARQEEKGGQH